MIGERCRIGIVLPSNNVVLEPELYSFLPDGVSAHFSRILATGGDAEALERMARQTPRAIRELSVAGMDLYAYACFSTSLVRKPGWDTRFASRAQSATGRPSYTAADATVAALKACGARKVSVVSPYLTDMHARVAPFFARHDLELVSGAALNLADVRVVGNVDPAQVETLVRTTLRPGAQAVCILATDLPTFELICPLESSLGISVISSNQALLWSALRRLGRHDRLTLGALFAQ